MLWLETVIGDLVKADSMMAWENKLSMDLSLEMVRGSGCLNERPSFQEVFQFDTLPSFRLTGIAFVLLGGM